MLFISKKRLEEEVQNRIAERRRYEDVYREMDTLRRDTFNEMERLRASFYRLEREVCSNGRTNIEGVRETATL